MSPTTTNASAARKWRLPRMFRRMLLIIATLAVLLYGARLLLGILADLNRIGVTGDAGADPARARIEWRGEGGTPVVVFDGAVVAKVPEREGENRFTVYYAGRRIGERVHDKTDAREDHTYIVHLHGPPDSIRYDLEIIGPDGARQSATSATGDGH